ncbi:hypothetical protein NEA10_14260 [Phormidium yuhuli AB48]|uniref:Uncharacterized protein n=1 Tax=Phormidium yuhuli AB48 TaxID=2940671 RepID=A0ABY5AMG9_9CYAN|nr:hypothetical protein [Phormidium yuhuli]USR90010.1 hypothetical protein NEA10_14260 [Phormidium yuhuli AB48]
MANTIKAQRAEILLGDISLEIFMLPDGTYCMSQTQVARSVERDLQELGDAYATNDIIRGENEELQRQLKAHGIEPFQDWPSEECRD